MNGWQLVNRIAFLEDEMKSLPHSRRFVGVYPVLILILMLGIQAGTLWGQSYAVRNITTNDGLPSSFVFQAIQDHDGFMWLLTDKGLACLSGNEIEHFSIAEGLVSNETWESTIDSEGAIWVNSYGPVPAVVRNGKVSSPYLSDSLREINFYKNNNVASQGDYVYFDSHHFAEGKTEVRGFVVHQDTVFPLKAADPEIEFVRVGVRGDPRHGFFCVAGFVRRSSGKVFQGIFTMRGKLLDLNFEIPVEKLEQEFSRFRYPAKSDKQMVRYTNLRRCFMNSDSLLYVLKDRLVLLTKNGLSEVSGIDLPLSETNEVHQVYRLDRGFLFKAREKSFITDDQLRHLPQYDFINGINFNSVTIDDRDNLWVCTSDQGVFLYPHDFLKSQIYHFDSLAGSDNVNSLATDGSGGVFIGLDNQRILFLKDSKLSVLPIVETRGRWAMLGLRSVVCHPDFGLVLGTLYDVNYLLPASRMAAGMEGLKSEDYEIWDEQAVGDDHEVYRNLKDISVRDSMLLFAMNGGVKSIYRSSTDGKLVQQLIDSDMQVYASERSPDGTYWMGTKVGLESYPPDHPRLLRHADNPLLKAPVNAITADGKGNLFVGTDGFGTFLLAEDTLVHFEPGKTRIVSCLYYSEDKNILLMGSNRGLTTIEIGPDHQYKVQNQTTVNGLPSNEVKSIIVSDSNVYVATNLGLGVMGFPPRSVENLPVPRLYIQEVKINGEVRAEMNEYALPYDSNHIELKYAGISHESGSQVSFWYRILPIDSVWKEARLPLVSLPSMASGRYQVEMKMFDISGNESRTVSTIFRIRQPFWERPVFILLTLLALIAGFIVVFEYRSRSARKRMETEAELKRKFSELELQALRSQLNPHFIFNLLNSFQRIIIEKDFLLANAYLGKFAKLMRLSLDSSRNHTVSLRQELDLLELYVSLEQLRFGKRFSFILEIDESIDTESFEVPGLIIQPFVENAILHGLTDAIDEGAISLKAKMLDDSLCIQVEDNGPGIDAMQARNEGKKGHSSSGIAIIQDRIEVMGQMEGIQVEIELQDLSRLGEGKGTRVVILFSPPKNPIQHG